MNSDSNPMSRMTAPKSKGPNAKSKPKANRQQISTDKVINFAVLTSNICHV